MEEFCAQLDRAFRERKMETLRLMIDEADAFLKSIAEQDYAPLRPLFNLRISHPSGFKVVLTGLNNVYRARRATANNGDWGRLGQPLCVRPLSQAAALRFLLRPLRFLGFRPGPDSRLPALLSCTNYYPGILHYFGYSIVASVGESFDICCKGMHDVPPFELRQEMLGAIMNGHSVISGIRAKFMSSLSLDERYLMLARCTAMLYHYGEPMLDGYKGYTVARIREMAEGYSIRCLAELSDDEYEALLDEMTEMGILHRAETGVYRLRRRAFLDFIGGKADELEQVMDRENRREELE